MHGLSSMHGLVGVPPEHRLALWRVRLCRGVVLIVCVAVHGIVLRVAVGTLHVNETRERGRGGCAAANGETGSTARACADESSEGGRGRGRGRNEGG